MAEVGVGREADRRKAVVAIVDLVGLPGFVDPRAVAVRVVEEFGHARTQLVLIFLLLRIMLGK